VSRFFRLEVSVDREGAGLLDGLRVVEAASMVLVPSAAAMLADFGADVVKVEPLEGDANRFLHELPGMPTSEVAYSFLVDNRSKRAIAADLKTPAGREILDRLLARADVFMTNYRPAALARLGLTWDDLAPSRPRLVYASASGFGDTGPEAGKPAYDTVVYWSRSGLESTMFPLDAWLGPIPAGAGDHPSATALFGAIMLGLFARERTGRGLRVTTSLLANGLWANATTIQAQLCGATFHGKRRREEALSFAAVYYRTRDGRVLKLAFVNPAREWPRFCHAIGRPDLFDDARLETLDGQREHAQTLIALLDGVFAGRDAVEWQARFEAYDVPFSLLPTYPEIAADVQAAAAGLFPALENADARTVRTVAAPISAPDVKPTPPRPAPALGAHTREVLAEIGYSSADIDALVARGVVRA
jgi:crotonobetainyl-CoA:carnitine CoA-transferase CaiB-like acyl-CoA transferase